MPGEFACECDSGVCAEGLVCENNTCGFPSGDGDGDGGDGDGGDGDGGDGDGGDGDGDGGLGECNLDDPYCPGIDGCMQAGGQHLVLDLDHNGSPDWAWCLFDCFNDGGDGDPDGAGDESLCFAHPAGGTVSCVDWSGMGDFGCFLSCDPNDDTSCASGSMCLVLSNGINLCAYLPEGF